jgi:protocatechuate 3,4-dioxygenase beta subunit
MKTLRMLLAGVAIVAGWTYAQTNITIEGTVVNKATGEPVAGAWVSAHLTSGVVGAISDSSGHFQMTASSGQLSSVEAGKAGFIRGFFSSWGHKPSLAWSGIRMQLSPGAVIWGTLVDDDGLPVDRAYLEVYYWNEIGQFAQVASASHKQSNDLGEFRINGLAAGTYYLRIAPVFLSHDWDQRYREQFYPGAFWPSDATPIELKAGERRGPMEIHVVRPKGVVVSARLRPSGDVRSTSGLRVALETEDWLVSVPLLLSKDGTYLAPNVPPGTYFLRIHEKEQGPGNTSFVEQKVVVGTSDVRDLELPVRRAEPIDVEGVVEFSGGAKRQPVNVILQGPGNSRPSATTDENGSFVIKGLPPGYYLPMTKLQSAEETQAREVRQASVHWGDRDITYKNFYLNGESKGPLRITYSPTGIVTGRLADASGRPVSGRFLVFWRGTDPPFIDSATTAADGSFTVALSGTGTYNVYAPGQVDAVDTDYRQAHQNDFPPLHVVEGRNRPIALRLPAQP